VRRNKVAVAAATIVLLGSAAAANIYLAQAQREAAYFSDLRGLANLFIFKYHDQISALPGSTELRKELVKDALAYLNNIAGKGTNDPDLLRELGTGYKRIGDVQGGILTNEATGLTISASNLGDTAGALDSYTNALALRRRVASLRPNDPRIEFELAESHANLGEIYANLGQPADAARYLGEAISMFQSLLGQNADEKKARTSLQTSYLALAGVLAVHTPNLGDTPGALAAMRKAIEFGEALLAADPHNAARRQSLAPNYGDIGRILFNDGQYAEALGYYRKALAIGESLLRENPTDRLFRRELAVQHRNVGGASLQSGQTAEALQHFREAGQHLRRARERRSQRCTDSPQLGLRLPRSR
jgi:tetratricopeptide (TPR) repeat protein